MITKDAIHQISHQQLSNLLGESLSESELSPYLKQIKYIAPKVGRFWQTNNNDAGVYLVLRGKVRILNETNNLIATLEKGATFGECTFFNDRNFAPYSIRTSVKVQLAYLSKELLLPLISKYPLVKEHLHRSAEKLDLLLSNGNIIDQGKGESAQGAIDPLSDRAKNPSPHAPHASHASHASPAPSSRQSSVTSLNKNAIKSSSPNKRSKLENRSLAKFPRPTQKITHLLQKATRRYPFFAQQSGSDCGAASLVMIARYWGKNISVNRLRDIANIDRNGASLRGLCVAAESIGFTTRPVKASLKQLAVQTLPAICHWEGKHYIVVYQITKDSVIVADPAIGQKTLSHEEFQAGWTGYVLLLEPTVLFYNTEEDKTSLWKFVELLKPHTLVLTEVLIASIFIQIFGLITPIFTQIILDRVVVQRSELTLVAVGLGLLIFSLFQVAMSALRDYLLDHTANKIDATLIIGFIHHTLSLPLSFFESRYVGDILSRVQENQKIRSFLTGEALSVILDFLTLFIYLGMMFWYSWQMALVALAIAPPFIILALVATPFLRRISQEIFTAHTAENSYLIETLSGINTIKSSAVEQTVRWHWEELLNEKIKKGFSGQIIGNQLSIVSNTIKTLATTILLVFGAYLVINNRLTIGQLVAFNMLLGNVISPFQRLAGLWNQIQEISISLERLNDVLEYAPEENLQKDVRQNLPQLQGNLRFDKVTFRYHPESEVNVLENLSFEIKAGQTVALVGRSGSGKTTISKLILGLYLPTSGNIYIDGKDLANVSKRSLRSQIGLVDQDTFLFGGTIRQNISLAHPDASIDEIREAARLAGADSFISTLPMGYETQIGEGGGMLSGGQRQRIAIARALLGNPRLLIFDEATSNLDTESERIIQNNLNRILSKRTAIVIAHRLSTIRNADLILVLDKGVLIERGNHQELMEQRGHYFYLNQQQLTQ